MSCLLRPINKRNFVNLFDNFPTYESILPLCWKNLKFDFSQFAPRRMYRLDGIASNLHCCRAKTYILHRHSTENRYSGIDVIIFNMRHAPNFICDFWISTTGTLAIATGNTVSPPDSPCDSSKNECFPAIE